MTTWLIGQTSRLPAAPDISLTWGEVGIAAALIVVNAIVSWKFRLGLERQILWSATRMVVQLSILGLVLHQIFSLSAPGPVLGLAVVMTIIAGVTAGRRVDGGFKGLYSAAIFSVWASSWLMTGITVLLIVRPQPWYSPQVVVPLLGMVMGNSLTGVSLALDRFLSDLHDRRDRVEMCLALGATRWEACREHFAAATRTAMIPILNTMSVAGIVSIPGMMTGQLLAGAPPIQAVQYQIMIVFMIAASIALGVVLILWAAWLQLTTTDHQIDWDQNWKYTNGRKPRGA